MRKILNKVFKTATFKQSAITFIGTILNGLLGGLFYVFVARMLGPQDFGLLTISIVTLTLISDVADIGINTGLIRFVSANLLNNEAKAMRFLKLSLEIKIVVWAIVFLVVFFLSPFLAEAIFHKVELVLPLRLVAFGVGGALLFSFATSVLQAYQKYFLWSGINIITNFLRLMLIFILSYLLSLNIRSGLFVYIILPFFGFFISMLILPAKKIILAKGEFSLSKELFKYNIPVAIFTLIAAVSSRLDTYLTASLLSIREVGVYGAANQLVQIMPQLVSAIGLVAAPKFASFKNVKDMVAYLKKIQLFVLGLSFFLLLTIPFVAYLIPIIYGSSYQEAVLPYIFGFLAMLVFLLSVPIHISVIFYFARPDVFIYNAIGHLLLIGLFGYFMISNYGIVGASLTVLAGTIFNLLIPLFWLFLKLRK